MKVEEELKKIKEELRSTKIYQDVDMSDLFSIHFGICMYIRNKYLWKNHELVEMMMKYYDVDNVDDISHKILSETKKEDNQSSNPNK